MSRFQLQLSPACDARPLLVPSEDDIVCEIQKVAEGVLRATAKGQRREYYKQASRLFLCRTPPFVAFGEMSRLPCCVAAPVFDAEADGDAIAECGDDAHVAAGAAVRGEHGETWPGGSIQRVR